MKEAKRKKIFEENARKSNQPEESKNECLLQKTKIAKLEESNNISITFPTKNTEQQSENEKVCDFNVSFKNNFGKVPLITQTPPENKDSLSNFFSNRRVSVKTDQPTRQTTSNITRSFNNTFNAEAATSSSSLVPVPSNRSFLKEDPNLRKSKIVVVKNLSKKTSPDKLKSLAHEIGEVQVDKFLFCLLLIFVVLELLFGPKKL